MRPPRRVVDQNASFWDLRHGPRSSPPCFASRFVLNKFCRTDSRPVLRRARLDAPIRAGCRARPGYRRPRPELPGMERHRATVPKSITVSGIIVYRHSPWGLPFANTCIKILKAKRYTVVKILEAAGYIFKITRRQGHLTPFIMINIRA